MVSGSGMYTPDVAGAAGSALCSAWLTQAAYISA